MTVPTNADESGTLSRDGNCNQTQQNAKDAPSPKTHDPSVTTGEKRLHSPKVELEGASPEPNLTSKVHRREPTNTTARRTINDDTYNYGFKSLEVAYPGTPASQQLIPRRSTATPPDYMVCYMAAQRIDEPNVDMHDSLLPYGALFLQVYPREEVEHALASAKVNMLSHTKKTGDNLAELYVPIMINTIAAILVRLAAATIHAFPLAHAAMAIKTSMTTEAKAAANLPPEEKLDFMLTAAQTALGKFGEVAMKHVQITPIPAPRPVAVRSHSTQSSFQKEL